MNTNQLIHKLFWQHVSTEYLLLGAALFVAVLVVLRLRRQSLLRSVAVSALCAYLFLVLAATVICRRHYDAPNVMMTPFWSYKQAFLEHNLSTRGQLLRNCILLFPMGFLLPFCLYPKKCRVWVPLVSAAAFAYGIELLQLVLHRGTFELVDDPLDNVIGAAAGYCLARFLLWAVGCIRSARSEAAPRQQTTDRD